MGKSLLLMIQKIAILSLYELIRDFVHIYKIENLCEKSQALISGNMIQTLLRHPPPDCIDRQLCNFYNKILCNTVYLTRQIKKSGSSVYDRLSGV